MSYNVAVVSLGCPKNEVDAEMILYSLKSAGFTLVPDEADADAIIINTCAFIEDAKKEAIENILEAAEYKKTGHLRALIVTGCLPERYGSEVIRELPEIDAVVGIGKNSDIAEIVKNAIEGKKGEFFADKSMLDLNGGRILGSCTYSAYIKVADGCDNGCTYCAIPMIRGRFRSRKIEDVVAEAVSLADRGVKELIVVAQDTTMYGADIYGKSMLPELLTELSKIDGIHWIRTLYTYPDRITDELLSVIASNEKCIKYLDIPIQHCNDAILKKMNRKITKAELINVIKNIRKAVPDMVLRTSLITGFPSETEEQFTELCEFVKEMRFDRLGCFAYSPEDGTFAASLPDQIDEQTKADRAEIIMNDQLSIIAEKNREKFGSIREVLVEGYDDYIKCYYGRSESDAPDIDAKVFFMSSCPLSAGDFVKVRIDDCIDYDLLGEMTYET